MSTTLNLGTAHEFSRQFVRNAFASTAYDNSNLDRALQLAGDAWVRITKSTRSLGTVTLAAGSNFMPAMPTGWIPEGHMKQTLIMTNGGVCNPNAAFTDVNEVLEAIWIQNGTLSGPSTASIYIGTPTMFGYKDASNGYVVPAPPTDLNMLVWFWAAFTAWTPGQAELTATIGTANQITGVTVVSGGYFTSAPTVTVTAGSGSGATFASTINQYGTISAVSVTAGGSGYTGTVSTFTNGATAAVISFNVADDAMRVIATDGCEAFIQTLEPQNFQIAQAALQRFEAKARQFKGRDAAGRGGNVQFRDSADTAQMYGGGWWPGYGPCYPNGSYQQG